MSAVPVECTQPLYMYTMCYVACVVRFVHVYKTSLDKKRHSLYPAVFYIQKTHVYHSIYSDIHISSDSTPIAPIATPIASDSLPFRDTVAVL